MHWINRLDEAPTRLDGPVAWIAPHAGAADWRLPSLTAADLADAARAKRDGGAPRLLRRRMLRALLGRLFGQRPDSLVFSRNEAGAPRVEGLDACISMSGCEGWSAVAVGSRPLGIDIETDDQPELSRWVLLEARGKALGRGLSGVRDSKAFLQRSETPQALRLARTCSGHPERDENPEVQAARSYGRTAALWAPGTSLGETEGPEGRWEAGAWTRQVAPHTLAALVELMHGNAAPLG